ncbi:L-seryl-tRNA(Sec) selenium transferase, partial [bacterium]|nr:L-seryl-tRNA(Sec) selenium transferase [candidate division CSSED10-310 bacterium]
YAGDYEAAIGDSTALIMKIHQSNFRTVGFTNETGLEELRELGRRHGIPVVYDMGSGVLTPLPLPGVGEMTAAEALRRGADLVCFSADKLLGGPQAGIIIGAKMLVDQLERNHLMRALRVCKLTCAALEATLRLYLDPGTLDQRLPVRRMLLAPEGQLKRFARRFAQRLREACGNRWGVRVTAAVARAGGGSLPLLELPGWAVAVKAPGMSPEQLHRRLLDQQPPILAMIREDAVWFDVRTLFPHDMAYIVKTLKGISAGRDEVQRDSARSDS